MTPSLPWSDALARFSPDLMLVIDRDGRVTWASESSGTYPSQFHRDSYSSQPAG